MNVRRVRGVARALAELSAGLAKGEGTRSNVREIKRKKTKSSSEGENKVVDRGHLKNRNLDRLPRSSSTSRVTTRSDEMPRGRKSKPLEARILPRINKKDGVQE